MAAEGASLNIAFGPLAHQGAWINSPTLHTSPKPSMELGPVSVSPRQPLDPMRFNGANMVPMPGFDTYADARVGPSTITQPMDMTDPNVRQLTRQILSDLDARGLLKAPGAGAPPEASMPTISLSEEEDFSMSDAKDKLGELMGNSAFVIGIFLLIFGSTIKNMGLLIVGAVFLGVPGAMSIVKTIAKYAYSEVSNRR